MSSTASSSVDYLPSANDKRRHRHSPAQLAELNLLWDQYTHPPLEARTAIGERIGMETKTVNAWFQNKRASSKKRTTKRENISATQLPPISSFNSASLEDLSPAARSHFSSAAPNTSFIGGTTFEDSDTQVRKMRMRPSADQLFNLTRLFNSTSNPTKEQREELAGRIGMRYQSITNWFQNQRSVAKKRKEEEDSEIITAIVPIQSQYSTSRSVSPSNYGDDLPRRTSPRHSSRSSTPYSRLNNILSQRPRRSRPEPYQLDALKDLYKKSINPSIEERTALAQEIGMDLGKVTNWFRNLRQTARKRATKKSGGIATGSGDDDDYDDTSTRHTHSPSVSRSGTPSLRSSSSSSRRDETFDHENIGLHSDVGSDEDCEEAVTPPQYHSPLAPPRPFLTDYLEQAPPNPRIAQRMNIDMIIDHPSDPRMLHITEQRSSFPKPTLPSLESLLPSHKFSPSVSRSQAAAYTPPPIREAPACNSKAFPHINVDDALLLLGIQAAFRH